MDLVRPLLVVLGMVSWRFVGLPTRRIIEQLPPDTREPRTFKMTDEALTVTSPAGSMQLTWAAITHVQQRPHAYLLLRGRSRFFYDIPRSHLTPDQDDELRNFLVVRGLLPEAAGRITAKRS